MMCRRFSFLILLLIIGAVSYGASLHRSRTSGGETFNPLRTKADGATHQIGVTTKGVVVDTIQYCYDIDSSTVWLDPWPYTGSADTVWWQFTPLASGTLMAVQGCFYFGGTAKLFVARYLRDSCYYLMSDPSVNPDLLPSQLFWSVQGNDTIWQTKDFMAFPVSFHIPLVAEGNYVVGYGTDYNGMPVASLDSGEGRQERAHDWGFSFNHETIGCGDEGWDCLCSMLPSVRTFWYYFYFLPEPITYPEPMIRAIVMYTPPIRPVFGEYGSIDGYLFNGGKRSGGGSIKGSGWHRNECQALLAG